MHPVRRATALLSLVSLIAIGACQGSNFATRTGSDAAKITANPPPETFNGTLTVTLTTDKPAEILATVDGSDPHTESASRLTGQSTLKLTLAATTTIRVFARTPDGTESPAESLQYTRAGGAVGTASGFIIYGTVAVGDAIGLMLDGTLVQTFPPPSQPGQIPWQVSGLTTGSHQVQAAADRNGDGNFIPVLDLFSPTVSFIIDTSDPFHASAENVDLYLGASPSGLCTIEGTISVPGAVFGESVTVNAFNSGSLLSGLGIGGAGGIGGGGGSGASDAGTAGGLSAQSILTELQNGYQVFATPGTTDYPYAITNLQPGSYVVIPLVTSLASGFSLDLLANPFSPLNCTPGAVLTQNFKFGPIDLSGTVTLTPATNPGNFVYGIVATRTFSFSTGIQAILMPTFFAPSSGGDYTANYGSGGLLDDSAFGLSAFTSADPSSGSTGSPIGPGGNILTGGGPILSAFTWALDPLSSTPAEVSFNTSGQNVTENFSTN
jgi:hypothetical protein